MDARDIIGLWPSAEKFSEEIGLTYPSHGRVMKVRNSIPHRHWDAVIAAAAKRGLFEVNKQALEQAYRQRNALASEREGAAA